MAIDARLTYVENEILQADPIRLVQLLYQGAIGAVEKARVYLREHDIRARSSQIAKAAAIVNELTLSIDREKGGEVAANLVELYDYVQHRLQEANFRQIDEPLAEVERLLSTLLEAWAQCAPPPMARAATTTPPPPAYASEDAPSYGPPRLANYY